MSEFAERLNALLAREIVLAKGSPRRSADMVGSLARGLGFTVAMTCGGDSDLIGTSLLGAAAQARAEALAKAPSVRLLAKRWQAD